MKIAIKIYLSVNFDGFLMINEGDLLYMVNECDVISRSSGGIL